VTHFFKAAHFDQFQRKKLLLRITLLFADSLLKILTATFKLLSKIFEPKYAIARTKCESVIVNCISQKIAAELRQELDKANFVSVT